MSVKTMFNMYTEFMEPTQATVTDTSFNWTILKDGIPVTVSLDSKQILTVEIVSGYPEWIFIHYVKVEFKNNNDIELKKRVMFLRGTADDCLTIQMQVLHLLSQKEKNRPKRLLVFINPGSGSRNNEKKYKSIVEPLFNLCGISSQVIVTTHANHPIEFLSTFDLTSVDCIVSMGGDGSMGLVCRGILRKAMADANRTLDVTTDNLVKPPVTLATICGGSGNAMSQAMYSSYSVERSALCIILGHTIPYDVMTTMQDNKWMTTTILITMIGAFNRTMGSVDNKRWLGPFRYHLVLPALWRNWTATPLKIDYLPAEGFEECSEVNLKDPDITDGPKPGWKTLSVPAVMAFISPWKLRNFTEDIAKNRYYPADYSSEALAVRLISVPFFDLMKGFITNFQDHNWSKGVRTIPVKECYVTADNWVQKDPSGHQGHMIASDGEFIHLKSGAEFLTRVHKDRMDMIALDDCLISEARPYTIF